MHDDRWRLRRCFFRSQAELDRIAPEGEIDADSPAGIFLSWLGKARIWFDKSGRISKLKERLGEIRFFVAESTRREAWRKVSYSRVHNLRLYESGRPEYHEALEIRLLYSVMELITAFLALRDEPWRGEKRAPAFIRDQSPEFYVRFREYQTAANLAARMSAYLAMIDLSPGRERLYLFRNRSASPNIVIRRWKRIAVSRSGKGYRVRGKQFSFLLFEP